MSAKSRQSGLFSVRTPEALAALTTWLAGLEPLIRKRGRDYSESSRVLSVRAAADHYLVAEVRGQNLYQTTLYFTREQWSATCSCPVGANCKHAAAAAFVWLANAGADRADLQDPAPLPVAARASAPTTAPSPETKKISFRDRWAPVIAKALGRALTPDEGRSLGNLSALFTAISHVGGVIYPDTLRRHGFDHTPTPGVPAYTPAFIDWWDRADPPGDPWALWQYIAYDYERAGRAIPEVFGPMTDTAAIRAALDDRLVKQEVEVWRRVFTPVKTGRTEELPASWADVTGVRARFSLHGMLFLETRSETKPWKPPTLKWCKALPGIRPADLESLTPPEAALLLSVATSNRYNHPHLSPKLPLPAETVQAILASRIACGAVVLPNGRPFAIEPEPLALKATASNATPGRLDVQRVTPDGRSAADAQRIVGSAEPLYLFEERLWRGPPALPTALIPLAVFSDPALTARLRAEGLELPKTLETAFRRVELRPRLRLSLAEGADVYAMAQFHAQLLAQAEDPPCEQHWSPAGWQWTAQGAPPPRDPAEPMLQFDLTRAQAVSARLADFRLVWSGWRQAWTRTVTQTFPDEFTAWRQSLPPDVILEVTPNLAGLLGGPLRGTLDFSAQPAEGAGRDWFDLTVALRIEDTTLSAEEIALLLKARGKWVRLPKLGWRRLEISSAGEDGDTAGLLDRLGLRASDVAEVGKPTTHRLHALQLAVEADALESRDAQLAEQLRTRAAALAARPPPAIPAGLGATLRPYQQEGFHFLAHLFAQGFGGILADDMGLGKTVQTLAGLLHLAAASRAAGTPFRALVVCPKSVVHGWLSETARFAPALSAVAFSPALAIAPLPQPPALLLITNYTQLRLHAAWFKATAWDVAVLDEGQFIKNPGSQAATVARALPARHRLVLTGTPIENRITDLWSLFAFAQPGLLGTQAAFARQYPLEDPGALGRLRRRVRHFLLRRTKAQAAPDLPSRTEDELVVELEPAQRKLYDAELKRARAQLLDIQTDRALDAVRFNVLASLLRLRQICCHPALIDPAHAALPSAKLDALLERLEELGEEGHQVLVFSQFVEMLELIRDRLAAAGIGHLMLTGRTENRAQLVESFQGDRTKTVFLLSLKAAGFGLNLTAASYVILYDPWWNPAVEAQAIDRTHRIGQLRPVTAYRLLAANTVEQKIRALQKEKSALANAVVQEESLASVLDLDSLRRILL